LLQLGLVVRLLLFGWLMILLGRVDNWAVDLRALDGLGLVYLARDLGQQHREQAVEIAQGLWSLFWDRLHR
jgi:hypothetical protein